MSKYTSVSGIYIILNTKNGKVYIGQAQDFKKRQCEHKRALNGKYHRNLHLQRAWNKYGEKAFKFQVLEYCPVGQLDEREQHYLDSYIPRGICYNISRDATAPLRGISPSIETRRKMSESNKGKKRSAETCRNVSIAKRTTSEETRSKMSESAKRRIRKPHSEETRAKLSEAAKRQHARERERKE